MSVEMAQAQAQPQPTNVATLIEELASYASVGRRSFSFPKLDASNVGDFVSKLIELYRTLASYASSPRTRSRLERLADQLAAYKDKIVEAFRKNNPNVLTPEEKKGLMLFDVAARAFITVYRGYKRGVTDPAELAREATRGIGSAIRAEWEVEKERPYADTVVAWARNLRDFDLPGVDTKETKPIVEEMTGARSRKRTPVTAEALEKKLEEYKKEIKEHFEALPKFLEAVQNMPDDTYDKLVALAQVKRYEQAVQAMRNPDALWDIFKDAKGRPLYERFVEAYERNPRLKGMVSPKFIAYQYAWRILSGFYVPTSIAQRLGLGIESISRDAYSVLRKELGTALAEAMKRYGVPENKPFPELSDEQKRNLAYAIVDAVNTVLSKIGVAVPAAA